MGFRNPLSGLPPSSITAALLAPGALDGQHVDRAVLTRPTLSDATIETSTLLEAMLQAGPGATVSAWDFDVITAAADPVTNQITWNHALGGMPTAIHVTVADSAGDVTVRPASLTPTSIGFVPRLPDGSVLDPSTSVTFYCWACR
jgi:hypothetical protein